MKYYDKKHSYYCGIDLHARSLYICILDELGATVVHKEIKACEIELLEVLEPYKKNIVVGSECMDCWYWVSKLCLNNNIEFILGHALYMRNIHGGKTKNDKIDSHKIAKLMWSGYFPLAYNQSEEMRATRDLLRRRSHMVTYRAQLKAHIKNTANQYNISTPNIPINYRKNREIFRDAFMHENKAVQHNINLDLDTISKLDSEILKVDRFIEKQVVEHSLTEYTLLQSIPGLGKITALSIIYEIGNVERFESVKDFVSYAGLIKCKAESGGKTYGFIGNKIANNHLKHTFKQLAVLYLKDNIQGQKYLKSLQEKRPRAVAMAILTRKLGSCVYYMLKRNCVFEESRLIN